MFSRSLQTLRSLNLPDSSRAPIIQNQLKEVKRTSVWQKDRAIESMAFENHIVYAVLYLSGLAI
jgi:hypothetical protein